MEQLVCIMHLLILQEASLVWEQQGLLGPRLQIGTMEQSLLPRSFDYRKQQGQHRFKGDGEQSHLFMEKDTINAEHVAARRGPALWLFLKSLLPEAGRSWVEG